MDVLWRALGVGWGGEVREAAAAEREAATPAWFMLTTHEIR